ncbi:MAG: RsmF rRNA methyltransferase first C-terminal domain-containing protein [Lachnospiraceae bacterium]|nr:RsmF rRNA methyltransferase first C-terminal domain-containing protein [Lachnospiraceae bacterium]
MNETPPRLPEELPGAFLERMKKDLSDTPGACDAFLSSYTAPPVHSLRLNTLRGARRDDLPFAFSGSVPWEPDGLYYEESSGMRPGKHILHEAGAYYIQEASAMLPAQLLASVHDDAEPLRVLDLCAAPGGKSVQLAMRMQGQGLLVSNEIHPARAQILSQNIERMGIANAVVTNESPERLAEHFPAFFDRILVDAPCSGEGMFRKNPEAVREWSPEAVEKCAERQRQILARACQMLAPGGYLVYSTCTFAPAEDEEMIDLFLREHPDFSLLRREKFLPHEVRGEGHFCALLRQNSSPVKSSPRPFRQSGTAGRVPVREFSKWLEELLCDPSAIDCSEGRLHSYGDHLYLIPRGLSDINGIRVLRPGLHLADILKRRTGDEFVPAHALSHALAPGQARNVQGLTEEEAAAYLGGQALRSSLSGRSHILMAYLGFPLGWARLAGGQLKNLYPKGLRLNR